MIDELEVTLPPWLYTKLLARVPAAAAAPEYVHFLQWCEEADVCEASSKDGGSKDKGASDWPLACRARAAAGGWLAEGPHATHRNASVGKHRTRAPASARAFRGAATRAGISRPAVCLVDEEKNPPTAGVSAAELRDRVASLEAALAGMEARLAAKLDALAAKGGSC
jgi:hypothetical protein